MPFNGLGSFSLVYDWVQDRNNGIKILASRMMGQEQDIADGLSNTLTRDGQSTVTNTISMSGNQITLLASATTRTGAMNLGQYQDGSAVYASASGTNTYVASLDPAITAYPDGAMYRIYFGNANTNAATATLNLNGVGARNLVIGNGTLVPVSTIQVGVGVVIARGANFQYFGSAVPTLFGLINGGSLATGASADLNTSYLVDSSGTARTVFLNSNPTAGDTMELTIFGTNNTKMWASGKPMFGNTATVETAGTEGSLIPRYTGASRGWVW